VQGAPNFCAWEVTRIYAREPDFSGFLHAVDIDAEILLRPQVSFLTPPSGVKPVDRVLKLEELDETLPEIAGRIGLPVRIGRLNASTLTRLSPQDVKPADRRRIEDLYYQDFVAFDYSLR